MCVYVCIYIYIYIGQLPDFKTSGKLPMDLEIPTLKTNSQLESNPTEIRSLSSRTDPKGSPE